MLKDNILKNAQKILFKEEKQRKEEKQKGDKMLFPMKETLKMTVHKQGESNV